VVTAINTSASTFIDGEIAKSRAALEALATPHYTQILTDIAGEIVESLRAGGKVLFCGNGGSAADSQHLAAELVGRQNYDRAPAAGIALTVDT
jgi:D-sedoheptulose 7-phosphate isomerase